MQLRPVMAGTQRWNECATWAWVNAGAFPPEWTADADRHAMFELVEEGTTGEWDEVTETVAGRPLVGVMVADIYDLSETANELLIVVDPTRRHQGIGTLMLKYLLLNHLNTAMAEIDARSPFIGWAVRRGTLMGSSVSVDYPSRVLLQFQFNLNSRAWPHGSCRCPVCEERLSSLTSRPSRRRPIGHIR